MAVPAEAQPAAPQCGRGESTTSFGKWFAPGVTLTAANRKARGLVDSQVGPGTVAVRLQMQVTAPPGQAWTVILRDPQLQVLAILDERDFAGDRTQWTGRLEANQVQAELIGGGDGLAIKFVSGLALPKPGQGAYVFSTQTSDPTWQDPFTQPETQPRAVAQSVGMLATGASSPDETGAPQKRSWCCSGAMLTADIYITNWHCGGTDKVSDADHWNSDVCANTVIDLGWHEGLAARRQYACRAVLHQNKRLDYALLRVRPIVGPGAATGRAQPVTVTRTLPTIDNVFLVHHAQCRPKLVSFDNCRIQSRSRRAWTDPPATTGGPDLTHTCDTEPGASGAPLFDIQGRMIALHHLGFEGGSPQCPTDRVNKATMMSAILDDLQTAKPAVFAELPPAP